MIPHAVRRFASWLLVLATLFAQLSVAAYACPSDGSHGMQAMSPCERMDREQPNLCDRHCHDAQQVQAQAPLPPGFVAAYVVVMPAAMAAAVGAEAEAPGLARPVFPPPSISHCRLRI